MFNMKDLSKDQTALSIVYVQGICKLVKAQDTVKDIEERYKRVCFRIMDSTGKKNGVGAKLYNLIKEQGIKSKEAKLFAANLLGIKESDMYYVEPVV